MREVIILIKDLIAKVQSDSATLLDYLKVADAIIHILIEMQQGPVIGATPDDEEQILQACSELGIQVPAGGPILTIALQMLFKYVLEIILKNT